MQCLPLIHTYTHTHTKTHAHPLSVTLTDKHTHPLSNFPCVSAVSSLQCDAPLSPFTTLRIIEYRSLAFAAVCKRVCLWTSVRLTGALQGYRHGNLSMGSSCSAVTEHRSQRSHEKGDKRGTIGGQEGVGERCSVWHTRDREEEPQGLELSYSPVRSAWIRKMRKCID